MDLYLAISNAQFFAELSEPSRRKLADAAERRDLSKKEVLFREGETGEALFLLLQGNFELSKAAPDGTRKVIKLLQSGEVFAEVVLFERSDYPVTATALSDCMVLAFPKTAVHQLLREEAFRNDFIAGLLRKQRYLAEKLVSLSALDVEARFFQFLREHFGESRSITLSISKKDVAAAIGTAPETLSRLIQKLESEGRLNWKGKKLELG